MAMNARLLRPRASGAAWTPALLGTQVAAWFDADDAATITLNGSSVSQWDDKSGNARNLSQGTAAYQPLYETTQANGKPAVTFDGLDDFMNNGAAGTAGINDCSFFVVSKTISASGQDLPIYLGNANVTRSGRSLYRSLSGNTLGFATWSNDISSSAYSLDIGGSYHIFGARQSGASVQLRRDGLGTNYALPQVPSSISINNLWIGHPSVSTYASNVSFAEILVFYSSQSDAVTTLVERYLASKWGISLG